MKLRNFGLDIFRALAILLVIFNHSINYFNLFPHSSLYGEISGIYGVELFFVLSGYLIGQIILRDTVPKIKHNGIKVFYAKRWLRTLPLYYLILIILIVLNTFIFKTKTFPFLHFFFLQNFSSNSLHFLGVSWSLAIEEWFYLLLPLGFLFIKGWAFKPKNQLMFLLLSIFFIILMRFIFVSFTHTTYDEIRKFIPLRFDSLLIGVVFAWIKFNKQKLFKELQKPSRVAVILTILALSVYTHYLYALHFKLDTSRMVKILSLPYMSILLASLLPVFEAGTFINVVLARYKILYSFFTKTSILSYSIYLVHVDLFETTRNIFKHILPFSYVLLSIALLSTYLVALFLFTYIERPIMKFREQIT